MMLVIILFLSANSYSQCSYRIRNQNNISYILPPKIKCLIKSDRLKNQFKNLTITCGLSSDYLDCISKIDDAVLKINSKSTTASTFDISRSTSTSFAIDINFEILFNNADPDKAFKDFSIELLTTISAKEQANSWPTSISQNIVEKIFEIIPIPESTSLARYGLRQETSFSIVPLHPKIHLRVDHFTLYDSRTSDDVLNTHLFIDSLKELIDAADTDPDKKSPQVPVTLDRTAIESSLDATSWRFQFTGQTIISYSKFQDKNNDVFFKFDPFIGIQYVRSGHPTNSYPDTHRRLLASSIDPDFTLNVNIAKYLFLFHKYLRGTNSNSSSSGSIARCCRSNPQRCNSLLFYKDDMELLKSNFDNCDVITDYALFGDKSAIVPMIIVEINSDLVFIPLGYTLNDLISNGYVKREYSFKRPFKKTIKNLKNSNLETILLPGDVFKRE